MREPAAAVQLAGTGLFAVLLAALLAAGCGAGGDPVPPGDPFPRGVVVAGGEVVCAPSSAWEAAEGGGWSFRGVAEVACAVLRTPAAEVALSFEPADDSLGFRFELEWDGRPLAGFPEGGRTDGTLRVALPPSLLAEGSHVLRLTRRREPDDAARIDNRFRRLGLALPGAAEEPFAAVAAERHHYLADLLITGVTGLGTVKTSGMLFAGPGGRELALPAAAAELHLRPENLSAAPARFSIEVDGGEPVATELAPSRRGEILVPLPARGGGTVRATLRVDGDPAGLYLWGAPRLATADAAPVEPPPIVLVTLDTTRRDALGAYGGPAGLTPHLDAFAAAATTFDRAASTAPWTLPAHASMLTGLYAGSHGAGVRLHRLARAVPSLPEELRRRGYHTAGFAGGKLVAHEFGVARGFDVYHDPEGFETRGDRLTEAVLAELDRRPRGPLFLFVNYFDPHESYAAPPAFRERTGEPAARAALAAPGEPPEWAAAAAGDREAWRRLVHGEAPVTAAGRRWLRAAYHAEVAFMDAQLGALFAALRRHGLWQRAWVVVVADHGELLGEEGRLSHAYRLDPELVDVPLLVKRPGGPGGGREAALTSVADLFPTLLAAAGAPLPAGLDGRPLGRPGDRGRVFFEEQVNRIHLLPNLHLRLADDVYGAASAAARRVVWEGGQQCARRAGEGGGWHPVACEGSAEAALAALRQRLGDPRAEAPPGGHSAAALSDEDRAALRALGYL